MRGWRDGIRGKPAASSLLDYQRGWRLGFAERAKVKL